MEVAILEMVYFMESNRNDILEHRSKYMNYNAIVSTKQIYRLSTICPTLTKYGIIFQSIN